MKYLYAIFVILLVGLAVMFAFAGSNTTFVRGFYGEKCYVSGSEHGNIEYPVYFDTLEDCLASLKK